MFDDILSVVFPLGLTVGWRPALRGRKTRGLAPHGRDSPGRPPLRVRRPCPRPREGRPSWTRLAPGILTMLGRLTPSGSRLGSFPSLRARAIRGTSLCSLRLLALRGVGRLPRAGLRRLRRGRSSRVCSWGGALGPQGRDPLRVLWGLSLLRSYKTRRGHRARPPLSFPPRASSRPSARSL